MNKIDDIRKLHARLVKTSAYGGLSYSGVQDQQAIGFLLRAVEQLAKSTPLLSNLYTSMFLSEGRNEGLPPQVQYWLQAIHIYLDGLDLDIRELME